jgi:hypothetical protein
LIQIVRCFRGRWCNGGTPLDISTGEKGGYLVCLKIQFFFQRGPVQFFPAKNICAPFQSLKQLRAADIFQNMQTKKYFVIRPCVTALTRCQN